MRPNVRLSTPCLKPGRPDERDFGSGGGIESESVMKDLQALVKAFPDPVIVISSNMKIVFFNEVSRDLLDQPESGLALSHVTRNSALLEAAERTFRKGKKTSVSFTLKKPFKRRVNATLIPLEHENEGDGADVIFIYMRDVSEQERLAKMRMHFIANASHELRTPLAAISGFVETLQTSAREDEAAREKFLNIMAAQARRMSRLIDDLLALSRLEMNAEPLPETRVDMVETLAEIIDVLRPQAEENAIRLKPGLPGGPLYVRGEKDELVQVFQNIIHNAIRYGGDGGKVWIEIKRQPAAKHRGARLAISVRDNGNGIAEKHIPRLTERFYRVDKIISRNKGGTGLGLAIAKHIIVRHRGKLNIESKPGKGAVFTVVLPQEMRPVE